MEHKEIHIEEDFWNDFLLEAYEHIDSIESNVMKLEQNPDDMDIIHTMFRAFHTIKGLSGFVEHTVIQEVAHKTETLMDFCRKGSLKVSTEIVNAILKSSDFIRKMCDDINCCNDEDFRNEIDAHVEVLKSLASAVDGNLFPEPPQNQPEAPQVEAPDESQQQEATPEQEAQTADENNAEASIQIEPEPQENQNEEQVQEPEQVTEQEPTAEEITNMAQEIIPLNPAEIIKPEEPKEEETQEQAEQESPKEIEKIENTESQATDLAKQAETSSTEKMFVPENTNTIQQVVQAPKPQKKEEGIPKRILSNDEYMKVANSKIDHLVDTIGELIINQSLLEQYIGSVYLHDNHLVSNMSSFLRITRELQNLSMSLRLVSLKSTFQKVSRIARDTIQELGKDVEFVSSGEETEIDRVVTDKLLDPLVHLIKNAISHGVESNPADREALGKRKKAKVELKAYNKRGKIFIEVIDDGRGIDVQAVYNKALEKGIIDPSKTYTEDEIKEFIMLPGFSTAKVVDNISGRGVGMDVVKTQVLKIGGSVVTRSEKNKGSIFTLEIPVNHAIMNGTIIDIRGQQFIIPTVNVKEILQPTPEQWILTQGKRTMLRVRDDIVSIVPISLFIKGAKLDDEAPLVMLLEIGQELRALPITNVINRQEVVVKPVGEEFANLKFISGMSILGTGKVSLILDVDYLFKKEVKE